MLMSGEEKPLLKHAEELVYRLRRILMAVGLAAVILSAIPMETQSYMPLISAFPSMLLNHVVPKKVSFLGIHYNVTLCQYKPFSGFDILIKTAVLLGVLGASPIIVHEIYAFIAPALYPHEAKALKKLSIAGFLLFLLGVLIAYYLVIPVAIKMMFILIVASSPPSVPLTCFSDVREIYNMVLALLGAVGISFEVPLVVYYLVAYGVVSPERLKGENMKYAFLIIMIIAAIISPDPTGITMLLLAIPYFALYVAAVKLGERACLNKGTCKPEAKAS